MKTNKENKTVTDLVIDELIECKGIACSWYMPRRTERGTDFKVYICPAMDGKKFENEEEYKKCIKKCKGHSSKENDKEICAQKIKEHFQDLADIPDGWDVLREELELAKSCLRGEENEKTIYFIKLRINYLEGLFTKYGIGAERKK